MSDKLEIIPLGGVGEFGMNCMLLRSGEDAIIIDAGMGFPEERVYGVDLAIPNFEFLEPFRDQLLAVILTHGHEDHIGALAYLLKQFNIPVYGSELTIALTESRLEEHDLLANVLLHRVKAGEKIELGNFLIEFIHVTHSLIDCFALAITTPAGTIIHTGDYKIDETPVIGRPIDLAALKRYGDRGVLALFADSTNSTVPGRTPSEREVIPAFEEIFTNAPGRIIVTTFSSSIHRLQVVFDVAARTGRKVCALGRSIVKNIEIADRLGVLKITDGIMIAPGEVKNLPPDEVVMLVTGSQGEPRAVLPQMATGKYKGLVIEKGDTVIMSARIIPGNE
ncbi:MAG: ribonuclease J, partial [Pyrinomonadaceae bacterium]